MDNSLRRRPFMIKYPTPMTIGRHGSDHQARAVNEEADCVLCVLPVVERKNLPQGNGAMQTKSVESEDEATNADKVRGRRGAGKRRRRRRTRSRSPSAV